MSFFNPNAPLLCLKPDVNLVPDSPGVWRCHWQMGNMTLVATFYTPVDQVCLIWGVICILIFVTAQFLPLSWITQAVWWSILSLVGIGAMVILTPSWLRKEGLGWVLDSWVILMLFGVILTDLSFVLGWGEVLMRLCPLWLGLVALGYLSTGLGMRSRTLVITGLVHLLSIGILPYVGAMQFLATGMIMGGASLILAFLQWDSFGTCGGQLNN